MTKTRIENFIKEKKFFEAEKEIRLILGEENTNGSLYNALGFALFRQGKHSEAVDAYLKALTLLPKDYTIQLNTANAYKALGNAKEAARHFQNAVKIFPALPDVWFELAEFAKSIGKSDDAIYCYAKAIEFRPDFKATINNLGTEYLDRGMLGEAEPLLKKLVLMEPENYIFCANMGGLLLKQKKSVEALKYLKRAAKINPNVPEIYHNVGMAYLDLSLYKEAIPFYKKALKLRPSHAKSYLGMAKALIETHKNKEALEAVKAAIKIQGENHESCLLVAKILKDGGREEQAEAYMQKALELSPPHSDKATYSYAVMLYDKGDFVKGAEVLQNILKKNPLHHKALTLMANMKKMDAVEGRVWLEDAIRALEHPSTPQDFWGLAYAIGKYYDDIKEYDIAFEYYHKANEEKKKTLKFDRKNLSNTIDRLSKGYNRAFLMEKHRGCSDSERPLFILGMPRSGTSLTEQILASHGKIHGAGELLFWTTQAGALGESFVDATLTEEMISFLAKNNLSYLEGLDKSALRVVDKMPGNFRYVGLIHTVFPNAKILHTMRNPIDTCLSIYFQNFNEGHGYASDLEDLAFYYKEYWRLMAHWRDTLPKGVMLDVRYEDVVEDQEGWSKKIIEHIGLEWDDKCLEFHKTERKVGTASNWQVKQPIYKSSKERWRNYEKFVGPLMPLLELYK